MISGEFSAKGELVFEIDLIGADGEPVPVNAVLDTGFTGWLVVDNQDAESLDWLLAPAQQKMQTATGEASFNAYLGTVVLDGEEFTIPVLGANQLENILLGVRWLERKRLVSDFPAGVLTLG
ncbi:MAG: aspartyl protease [Hormoscilla sp. GM102CHS1]|nr:aspartyl protease [Hormoscilla sp. SP12CHS1]MBC6473233.1 aspartyl protease [Hormoscilla sp. GM102CHS1]